MGCNSFTFRQFVVQQDLCGMKVGTDGVLLGAWAHGGKNILDIGTGTGLIAMMMAQRFPESQIDALDIDEHAFRQAQDNVGNSPFAQRIHVQCCDIRHFTSRHLYDSIVSNPPFFTTGQRSDEAQRALARHTDTLPYSALFKAVCCLLKPDGEFSAIIPYDFLADFTAEGYFNGFSLTRRCTIKTTQRKAPRRCLLAFSAHHEQTCENEEVTLQDADGRRTEWYNNLTKSFYIR